MNTPPGVQRWILRVVPMDVGGKVRPLLEERATREEAFGRHVNHLIVWRKSAGARSFGYWAGL
jgi:hypothetical protein